MQPHSDPPSDSLSTADSSRTLPDSLTAADSSRALPDSVPPVIPQPPAVSGVPSDSLHAESMPEAPTLDPVAEDTGAASDFVTEDAVVAANSMAEDAGAPSIPPMSSIHPTSSEADDSSGDSAELLRALLERAVETVGAQHGMALVVDLERQMLICRALHRLPARDAELMFYRIGQGNTGRVAATGRPIRLGATGESRAGGSALLIVPVKVADDVIAVLNLNRSASRDGFTEEDERRVLALADESGPPLLRALNAEASGSSQGVQLSQLVSPGALKDIQDAVASFLGAPVVFEDAHGRCLAPISSAAEYCVLMRSRSLSALRCEISMTQAGSRAEDDRKPYTCECHAGVKTCAAPIFVRQQYLGSLVLMLRFVNRDSAAVRGLASELGLDPYETLAKASHFPALPADREAEAASLLGMVAEVTGMLAEAALQVRDQEQRVKQKANEIGTLRELTQQLTGVVRLDPLLAEVTRKATRLAGAAAADVTLMRSDGSLQVRSSRGLSSEVVDLLAPAMAESPAAGAIQSESVRVVENVARESRYPGWVHAIRRQPQIRSAFSIPLGAHERPIGALTVYSDEPGAPSEETILLLRALAEHGTLAIQSAQATEQARSNEQALRLFLSRMTRGLSSSIDTAELIRWVADFAAQMTRAAHCAVYELVGETLHIRAMSKASRTVIEQPTLDIGEGLSGRVASSRKILQVADVRKDPRFLTSAASTPADAVRYLGAPLLYKKDLLGVLAVYSSGGTYADEDIQLISSFAGQAAVAIQNARSYEHQRQIASTMQQSFLPREMLRMPGLEIGARYNAAVEEVGGDYYDFLEVGPRSAFVVLGDVSGKGIRAATYTAMGKYVLRAYAFEDPHPTRVLERMNALLSAQIEPGTFITLFYGLIDLESQTLHYGNAGHPDGLLYLPATGTFKHLSSTGMMVGAVSGEAFSSVKVPLEPGAVLVLYTDGVIEARRGAELFGMDRLKDAIKEHAALPAEELVEAIYKRVQEFHDTGMSDDTCILAFRFLAPPGSGISASKGE